MIEGAQTRGGRLAAAAAWLLAGAYAAAGLVAMWAYSPRVPYADAWRQLARFLSAPFPANVVAPENGHSALLPNLLRVLDIRLADGNQLLLTIAGIVFVLATVALAWRMVRELPTSAGRAAAMLVVSLGLFWFGNARVLMHGAESVHAYMVTLFLMAGLCLLVRDRGEGRGPSAFALLVTVLCGLAATFSFGSGVACFAGFGMVMLLRRSAAGLAVLVAGAALAYLLVQAAGGTGVPPAFDPPRQVDILLRWLGGPPGYASQVLLDPGAAYSIPLANRVLVPLAQAAEAAFGPMAMSPRWPHAAWGVAGLALMAWLSWRAWRSREGAGSPAALAGIGLAAFALATGMLLAVMRLDYFAVHPGQVLAHRYVPWSSLFWAGLALAGVVQSGWHRPLAGAGISIALALLVLPSQSWTGLHGAALVPTADRVATAVAVGVIEPDLWMGENVVSEIAVAEPLSKAAGLTVHAWPETRALGSRVPADAVGAALPVREVTGVDNLIGPPGRRVVFDHGRADCQRMLLVDADGVVRGMARKDLHAGPAVWVGWMQGDAGGTPRALECAATHALAARRAATHPAARPL